MGATYILVVYKVYRYDTFISRPQKDEEAEIFFDNWSVSTVRFDDHFFLLVIDMSFLLKGLL